ncbi:MAG: hypothetical protein KC933_05715 [Myxococcales bacterium]|nr:hypothetical protein [Myxococcales bacterium]
MRTAAALAALVAALWPASAPAQESTPRTGPLLRVEVEAVHQRLYADLPMTLGSVSLAIGGAVRRARLYGLVGGGGGRTAGGLLVVDIRTGGILEGFRDGLHYGLQADFDVLMLSAITDGQSQLGLGFGGHLFCGYDVLRFGPHALYLDARLGARFYPGDDLAGLWDAGLAAGYRY